MNKFSSLQELGVYIDSYDSKPLSLKTLIQGQCVDNSIPSTFNLTLTIAPNLTITLIDDLVSEEYIAQQPTINHSVKLVIHEHSLVKYTLKLVPETHTSPTSTSIISKELIVSLVGNHAQADVFCACYGLGNRIFKFKTIQDHQKEHTTSNLVIKSVLDDASKLIFNGMISIQKGAQHSIAEQTNKNIILGAMAKAISAPQLEIEANDVVCKHGAAVSKLNKDQMFYLQSRGLDHVQTRTMLVDAFLN